jgi:hypothetical protein
MKIVHQEDLAPLTPQGVEEQGFHRCGEDPVNWRQALTKEMPQ